MQSVGEMLAHTAEAASLSRDPERRAAAESWLKVINRQLAKLTKQRSPQAA